MDEEQKVLQQLPNDVFAVLGPLGVNDDKMEIFPQTFLFYNINKINNIFLYSDMANYVEYRLKLFVSNIKFLSNH